jgi:hypothetical protein
VFLKCLFSVNKYTFENLQSIVQLLKMIIVGFPKNRTVINSNLLTLNSKTVTMKTIKFTERNARDHNCRKKKVEHQTVLAIEAL